MSHLIDILIPTYNNPQYLYPCVRSLLENTATPGLVKIHVINNGDPYTVKALPPSVNVIQMDGNKNWCGGLKAGIEATEAPYVLLCNDDIHVPASSRLWPNKMIQHFIYPECAAVGPSSNFVMGSQGIWTNSGPVIFRVPFLIGFFMMVRRSDLMAAGGIDVGFTCGDDLDLSIRLRDLGKSLVCDKEIFIYHHGAKTGPRVEGSYWYSAEQQITTWNMLFQKHGVKHTFEMLMQPWDYTKVANEFYPNADLEGDLIRNYVQGEKILELGCGGKKTVPNSFGIDIVPSGERIPNLKDPVYSVADDVRDVSSPLPYDPDFDCVIARHILEHVIDPIETLTNWVAVLKQGGRIILALPNQNVCSSIPMNPEHVHAFTPTSIRTIAQLLGLKEIDMRPSGNNISFVSVWSKNGLH